MSYVKKGGRIIIVGAGPTGLGAAYLLNKLGYKNWAIYEKEDKVGGLSSSFKDKKGFTWDIGGHVMFSNIEKFNSLADLLLGDHFISHERESWIRMMGRWIPYPFQNNIRHLSRIKVLQCLLGLIQTQQNTKKITNFKDWILKTFGQGIAENFMFPYNFKVWAFPLTIMDYGWIAERISPVSIEKIIENIIMEINDTGWGPNNQFKFPLYGGTGGFFNCFKPFVKNNFYCCHQAKSIDIDSQVITFNNGKTDCYDFLINTAPIDLFVQLLHSQKEDMERVHKQAGKLLHNGVYIVGIGLKKHMESTKCWVYFPDENIPFYRMTYFSNYSPNNVPFGDITTYSSLMCEVSFSSYKYVSESEVIDSVIQGLITAKILGNDDKNKIISTWKYKADYAYPVPSIGRDDVLVEIQTILERNRIYSRGRFGAWKYEIGNMDHSVMMGMEVVNRILFKKQEQIWNL